MHGEDPAVVAWRIALAPRPRYSTGGRHWWRDLVTGAYADARAAWEALRESDVPAFNAAGAANSGAAYYQLSDEEFAELHPPPMLGDFMRGLSQGSLAPEALW